MKSVILFPTIALVSLLAFAISLTLDLGALPLFATTVMAWLFLTWSSDYRRPRDYAAATTIALRSQNSLPLAA